MIDETEDVESGATFVLSPWWELTPSIQTTAMAIMAIAFIGVLVVCALLLTALSPKEEPYFGGQYNGPGPLPYVPNTVPAVPETTPTATADGAAQASAIDNLLRQAQTDRQSVNDAVNDLESCGSGKGISADISAIDQAAANRATLASQVSGTDVSQISGGGQATQQLVTALQDSADADKEFSAWGQDLKGHCDSSSATSNAHYTNAMTASSTASSAKTTFVGLWNPIAQSYNFTQWSESDF